MDVVFTSLEALILKATHESLPQPDAAALEAFCAVMRDATDGAQLATRALAARIQSLNPREALLALTMMDRCMRRCDASFHAEVGKFRFLNEMIKLVSPKYYAERTAPEVRTRVLQFLHAWTIEYPKETKFKVAYDMLKNQGVVKETPPPLPPEEVVQPVRARARSAVFEDEEKSKLLQKLLQSKKPEDLQHANRLIKTMVREEERRTEASCRRMLEVGSALDSAGLLGELLMHARNASADEEQLIHELHARCLRLQPALQHLAATTPDDHCALDEIFQANHELDQVSLMYNDFVSHRSRSNANKKIQVQATNGDQKLLDFASGRAGDMSLKPTPGPNLGSSGSSATSNTLDALGDIFATESGCGTTAELLKPISLMPTGIEDVALLETETIGARAEGWGELDCLGEQLLRQALPEHARRPDLFISKSTKKVPMNALEKTSTTQSETGLVNNDAILDLDFFTNKLIETPKPETSSTPTTPTRANDDLMVDISLESSAARTEPDKSTLPVIEDSPLSSILDLNRMVDKPIEGYQNDNNIGQAAARCHIKPLTDIVVTLESVKPSQVPPLVALEDESGISVVLHFGKEQPRPDVYIIVVSTTNKSPSPIEDYKFQPVVPKGCKVRLLGASGCRLPGYNPFLPPPALTQIMLLARPPHLSVVLKFVITYSCEGVSLSDIGEALCLPLDSI